MREQLVLCALSERDPAAAERALVALGDNDCWGEGAILLSRSFGEGLVARMTKDDARGRTAFEAARAHQEKIVQAQPDYGPALCVLGLIDAALGRKDLALDEGRRAIALTPLQKDVNNGSRVLQYFAITAAWAGDKELALQQLETGLRAPNASLMLSYGALKLFPVWDPLRGDPRFEKSCNHSRRKRRSNDARQFAIRFSRNLKRHMTSLDYYAIEELLTDDERAARDRTRRFVQEEVMPVVVDAHRAAKFPDHLRPRMGKLRLFCAVLKRAWWRGTELHGLRIDHARVGARRLGFTLSEASVQGALAIYAIHSFGSPEQTNVGCRD